ncbi:TldD/PmbA family protein [Litorimonas sp. WD9-15]|uniref:TldD/PmbA family protein n=1 Tax=Litorimonas sp. WD9-15 TaxID=3418716 RepID=UPI003D012D3F
MPTSDPITSDALYPTLKSLLREAKLAGAETADAIATHGRSLGIAVRENALEDVDSSEGKDIGLRVMVGKRQACVSSSDLSKQSLKALAERAVAMAKLAPEDPWCGLADPERLAQPGQGEALDVYDTTELDPATLKSRAHELEAATLSIKGVAQAEGANASWSTSAMAYATSHGFLDGWRASRHGLSVSAIAESGGAMERDYDYESTRYFDALPDPASIGHTAGRRAVARLGSRQIASSAMPVIFDERVAASLIASLLGAISGPSITRGVSFLKDKLNTEIFSPHIQIVDDPLLKRGNGSRPWDGEGLVVQKQHIVEDGVLKTWLLNCASARQLGMTSTGHATRGLGSPPGVSATNTWLVPGEKTPEALAAAMGEGFLISEMFGPSLNSNTGDYSVGVSGFKIENGLRAFPVSEVTIAGNLLDMYRTMIPANDLKMDSATCSPSLLVEGLTLAGS